MNRKRARIVVTGAVQGVGFRPFVYRLARELELSGWVANSAQGVLIEVEGEGKPMNEFVSRLQTDKPALASIQNVQTCAIEPVNEIEFEIRDSDCEGDATALILPDIATCAECLREIFDPKNRRHLYPFTNCTHCGPRFSIIESLPYDRANTSMKKFAMCPECKREYHDPMNRRFHAQPNACPQCGPQMELWDERGSVLSLRHEVLLKAAAAIRDERIVALKGVGGFQLIVDARNEDAVRRLRARKRREDKPFAVMAPSLDAVQAFCIVGEWETHWLKSPAAPIVLLKKSAEMRSLRIADSVAPGNPSLGVMLPYSPLHHLLLSELDFPVVATSGNLTDEPICIDERDALERLRGVADLFLVHNRPIVRHVDDSVVRIMLGREMVLRRARGFAPLPISISDSDVQSPETILAFGAHLKSTVALCHGNQVFISQHIGDLESAQALSAFRKTATDLPHIYGVSPQILAHDLHPDYASTKLAREMAENDRKNDAAITGVQHHYAHILSCLAENEIDAPVLGVAWDGTGLGTDGTVWGGEFLRVDKTGFGRFAHFRQFRLPGGDVAARQPRRAALGLLYEIFGRELFQRGNLPLLRQFSAEELRMIERMLAGGINSPVTSSAGRFFDAIAAMCGLRQRSSFEGQAAMELEFVCSERETGSYPFELKRGTSMVFDWQPAIIEVLKEIGEDLAIGTIASKIHNTLAEVVLTVARAAGERNVVLSGGCFQNEFLTERVVRPLREHGFVPHWHRRIPPNDGGIAFGQIVAAKRASRAEIFNEPDHLAVQET